MVEEAKILSEFHFIECPSCYEAIMVTAKSKFCTECAGRLDVEANSERKRPAIPERPVDNDETWKTNNE